MKRRTIDVQNLLRENIRTITPYSSARNEFSGQAQVFLDANENFRDFFSGTGRNRYPDPLQRELKQKAAELLEVPTSQLFLGNGSDEAIDLLFRAFAIPGVDRALIQPPTYGVYSVFAHLNDVGLSVCPLDDEFQMDMGAIERMCTDDPETLKLLFICSPNNPTGNDINVDDIRHALDIFPGIVVVDEAYQDFSDAPSTVSLLDDYENLVVLRTFSKAWGLANIRIGMACADERIIEVFNNIKYPYNISGIAQETALEALNHQRQVEKNIELIKTERERVVQKLNTFECVVRVYDSSANFLLVKTTDAKRIYTGLKDRGIIIRDRSNQHGCEQSVRITIGSPDENERMLEALEQMEAGA